MEFSQDTYIFLVTALGFGGLIAAVFFYVHGTRLEADLEKRERELKRRLYELTILKELGERVGYSLNVENIIEVITSSLRQFLEYRTVSYMLIEPEEVVFHLYIDTSVGRGFVDEIRDRMLSSLDALLPRGIKDYEVKEVISGAPVDGENKELVRSYFNIPLVISGEVVGVLTVAHVEEGLYREEEMTLLYKIVQQASSAFARLQDVVAEEEHRLNAMVESMPEGVIMTDLDYRIIVVNPAAKRDFGLLGENKKETQKITILDFMEKSGQFSLKDRLEQSVREDKMIVEGNVLIEDRFYEVTVSPVKGISRGKEEVLGHLAIFRDVTLEKVAEQMRENFISMMVHELRTPLGNISKAVELILRGEKSKRIKEYEEYLEMVHHASLEMLDWVNDFLDVTKMEVGKFQIQPREASVRELIDEAVGFFKAVARDAHIKLTVHIDDAVPQASLFDLTRASQIVNNLLSNALKFTHSGGEIVIQAFMHAEGEDIRKEAEAQHVEWRGGGAYKSHSRELPASIVVSVTDTGIGISPEHIPLLFNRFSQIQQWALDRSKRGTGLGLVIAKGVAEAHGGIVGVYSEENVGSTFYFTLPLNPPIPPKEEIKK